MVIEFCGSTFEDYWTLVLILEGCLTFLAFLAYFTFLIFIEFSWLNWLIIGGLLLSLILFRFLIMGARIGLITIMKCLGIREQYQVKFRLALSLVLLLFWGFAPRVAVFWIGWHFHIIPCIILSHTWVTYQIRRYIYICKDLVMLYYEREDIIWGLVTWQGVILIASCRLVKAYYTNPWDIASIIVCQVMCTPVCILATVDMAMLVTGSTRITVVREHQVNSVAPIVQEVIQMEMKERKERLSFECKICFEEYSQQRIPKSLTNCDHTICEECIKNCLQTSFNQFIMCPVCQQVTVVKGGAATLSTNLVLLEVIEEIKKND